MSDGSVAGQGAEDGARTDGSRPFRGGHSCGDSTLNGSHIGSVETAQLSTSWLGSRHMATRVRQRRAPSFALTRHR